MSTQLPHEIIDRASEWFLELREEDVSDDAREAFTEWLRSSPAHVQAYLEVAGTWGDASQVSREFVVELGREANLIRLEGSAPSPLMRRRGHAAASSPAAAGEITPFPPAHERREVGGVDTYRVSSSSAPGSGKGRDARSGSASFFAFAASMLLMLVGVAGWFYQQRGVSYTDTGEQRVITLDDGSIVRLNSRSKMRVQLTPQERHIELLEGQAHFQVAKDKTRPFTVHTNDITARAVGTQFDVYRKRTGTIVTVVEGRVAIASTEALVLRRKQEQKSGDGPQLNEERAQRAQAAQHSRLSNQNLVLSAGEQATVSQGGTVDLQPQANVAAATGWLQQELIFTGEPLSTVIDEFNRYTRRTIVLDDLTLAQFKINAAFNTTNPKGLLLFLSRMDGVEVIETEDEVHIRAAP